MLPIYKLTIDNLDETGVDYNAFVDVPAHMKSFIAFGKQQSVNYSFNEEQRIVTGVMISANTPIYRRDNEFGEHLVVFDADTISEFSTFIEKQGSWMADEGYFDDLVMSLVLLAWMTSNPYFKDMTNVDIREKMYRDQMDSIEDELTPFGIINSGQDNEIFVADGDLWKVVPDEENVPRPGWLF